LLFKIESPVERVCYAVNATEATPAVGPDEGHVERRGDPRPRDLEPGASTLVAYPLLVPKNGARRKLRCKITRTDDPSDEIAPAIEETKAETPQARRGGRRPRRADES
jgi:hypothetical protein